MKTKGRVYKINGYFYAYIKKWYSFKWELIEVGITDANIAIGRILVKNPTIKDIKVIESNYSGHVDK